MDNDICVNITTTSPGKILICGGYLIISERYSGCVLTTNTPFTCKSNVIIKESMEDYSSISFLIYSKYVNTNFNYKVKISKLDDYYTIDMEEDEKNVFIKYSIISAIYFFILNNLDSFKTFDINYEIEIDTDYKFYSHTNDFTTSSKTGLGSSSALVTSLVSNIYLTLVKYIAKVNVKEGMINELPYNIQSSLLQAGLYANNLAQNKVI
jgi:phosphomevalonate kinase